jgi:4-cresol dehydrogenase (hydroxylating)
LPFAEKANLALEAGVYVHGLGRGVPSDQGMEGEMKRAEGFEKPGLFWCSPTFAAEGGAARKVVEIGERLFEAHGFDLPVTITFVTANRVIATMSCCFDDADEAERARAHELFFALHRELTKHGISTYREGILGMDDVRYTEEGKDVTLSRLKNALDPQAVISPGRYGIG